MGHISVEWLLFLWFEVVALGVLLSREPSSETYLKQQPLIQVGKYFGFF